MVADESKTNTKKLFFFLENLLIIFRTNTSDSGSYTCKASNLNSSDETTVNITMEIAKSSTNMGKY